MKKALSQASSSFYRPEGLTALSCDVTMDWTELLRQLGQQASENQMKLLTGMRLHFKAVKEQPVLTEVTWADGEPSGKEKIENGSRQMLGGFFQMYWSILVDPMFTPTQSNVTAVRTGAGDTLLLAKQGTETKVKLDADMVPVQLWFFSPVKKGTIVPHFTKSDPQSPGDLRRLTALDVAEEVGTTVRTVKVVLDYQPVTGLQVPHHLSFGVGGAYAIPMEFTGCVVSR